MNLYLDIETIGTDDPTAIEEIAASITPPGNISKAETIAAWHAEKKPALIETAVRNTSFDGGLGRIIVFGYAIDEGEVVALHNPFEADLLRSISDTVSTSIVQSVLVVGHNVTWDIRFLWQRFVVNNVPVPLWLKLSVRSKPWEVGDTMAMWNPDREKRISLDRLCRTLGIPTPKGDMDGSKVWDAYRAGEIDKIADYCRGDVEATRACYQRMIG